MIVKIFKKKNFRDQDFFVEPDEIFLDSKNIQNFDSQQFEGRIEKPISKKSSWFLGVFFLLFIGTFITRLGYLQINKGEAYFQRSINNNFEKVVIFADRGIIYDRNKKELAWNVKSETVPPLNPPNQSASVLSSVSEAKDDTASPFGTRAYLAEGFSHLLGYVSTPSQDKAGKYWQTEFVGKDGIEKEHGEKIKGVNGSKMIETDVHGKVLYQNIVNPPQRGDDLVTTIDSALQKKLYDLIKNLSEERSFAGGAGVIMDITNGEILTSTSFPEYDSNVMSDGKDTEKIKSYLSNKKGLFLDKTISGLYAPGSIVKPFFALGALNEGIISPDKKILSTGSLSLPNPYDKSKPTIFKDWKAHGWTDMREAIAVSSDVYFYTIGGGFGDQRGLGISNIEKYAKIFGIGQKTGIDIPDEKSGNIPSPEWKAKNFKGEIWRIGDTYHTAIGQYGFQVTPMEMVRATAALANYGTLLAPHLLVGDTAKEKETTKVDFKKSDFDVIHEGMRMTVTKGTATALNVPYVKVAAKTGTAQLGVRKDKVNSWIIGFFPYENPKYAFTIMMEAGPSSNGVGAASVMRGLLDWMYWETPEYLGLPKKIQKEPAPVTVTEVIPNDVEVDLLQSNQQLDVESNIATEESIVTDPLLQIPVQNQATID